MQVLCLIECALGTNTIFKACLIAQLIPRMPIGIVCSNSSLHTAGGYCNFNSLRWYIEWPPEIQAQTIRYIVSFNNVHLISINAPSYAMQIISMMGCYLHVRNLGHIIANLHLIFLLKCDNMQGKTWLKRAARAARSDVPSHVFKLHSCMTTMWATTLAMLTQNLMSLPMGSHAFCPNSH